MNIPLNINLQQILLHLMNFAILAGGLYFLLYNPVKKFMAQRTAHYQELDDAAQKKLAEADRLKEQYTEQLKAADEQVHAMRADAMRAVQDQTDAQLADAARQAEAVLREASREAARSREKILAETRKDLKELAVTATEKLLLESEGDPIDQFLKAAERGNSHVN